MATTFAVAADKELWDALNHKSTLLEAFRAKNSSHPERDNLAIAHTILESFLTRLGAILDVESPETVPGYLKSISAKTESALFAPIQCDLVDGNSDRVARKTTNAIITSTHQHMSDGTLIVTQKQMGCAVALICAEARPKLTELFHTWCWSRLRVTFLLCSAQCPSPICGKSYGRGRRSLISSSSLTMSAVLSSMQSSTPSSDGSSLSSSGPSAIPLRRKSLCHFRQCWVSSKTDQSDYFSYSNRTRQRGK